MKSDALGLPIFYQQYPEYFDAPGNAYNTNEKNVAIEIQLKQYDAKTVLDLTCGTGSQVIYLAKLGYQITGSDFSPGLIDIAKEKALDESIAIEFIHGDMRDLHAGKFDAVITIDNAIDHLVKDDFEVALKNIRRNLNHGGIYIFDILNLDAMTDHVIEQDNKKMTNERVAPDGTIIKNKRHTTIDRLKGYFSSDNHFTIIKNGKENHIDNRCSLQIYTMGQLKNILSKNGFEVIKQLNVDAYTFHEDDTGYSILTIAKKVAD